MKTHGPPSLFDLIWRELNKKHTYPRQAPRFWSGLLGGTLVREYLKTLADRDPYFRKVKNGQSMREDFRGMYGLERSDCPVDVIFQQLWESHPLGEAVTESYLRERYRDLRDSWLQHNALRYWVKPRKHLPFARFRQRLKRGGS